MKLRILLVQEHIGEQSAWVACGLEKDIVAQGDTQEEALQRLGRSISAHMLLDTTEERVPLSGIEPAPPYLHALYERAEQLPEYKTLPLADGFDPLEVEVRSITSSAK